MKMKFDQVNKREVLALVAAAIVGISCGLGEALPDASEIEEGEPVAMNTTPVPTLAAVIQEGPLFEDDFEAGAGDWFVEETSEHSFFASDGKYIIEVREPDWYAFSEHPDFYTSDANDLLVDIAYLSGPTESRAGIAFRCDADDEAWLELSLDVDGYFAVYGVTWSDSQFEYEEVVPLAFSSALQVGHSTNHIRLVDDDSQVTVYINGEMVATFAYDELPPGCPILFVGTYDEEGSKWAFDNVLIRPIEKSSATGAPPSVAALASQVSSLTMQALRKAVGAPPLAHTSTSLVSFKAPLQQGAYRVDCPTSGYMEMTELPADLPFIGEVEFENAIQVYKGCSFHEGELLYTTNGTLTVSGSYHVDESLPHKLQLAGQLATSPGEDCPVDGRVAADGAFAGTICAWPITLDPLPPPAPMHSPAELLAGKWSGRASFRDASLGCSGPANFTFVIQGSGESISGTYTYTVGNASGPDPICSRACGSGGVVGCMVSGGFAGTARNGVINFTAGGLTVNGTYRHDGQWMGGHYQGTAMGGFFVSGDWQTILK